MNLKKTIKTLAISLFLAVAPNHASAQDLIARQAPVDRKMAAVDTIMLRNITIKEKPNRLHLNYTPTGTINTLTAQLNCPNTSTSTCATSACPPQVAS